jgi:hypothetical protein
MFVFVVSETLSEEEGRQQESEGHKKQGQRHDIFFHAHGYDGESERHDCGQKQEGCQLHLSYPRRHGLCAAV